MIFNLFTSKRKINFKRKLYLLSVLYLFPLLFFSSAQAQNKKVVFVIADGIPTDVIERIETPNLDKIANRTGYARAHVGGDKGTYSETPTISAVGYNSLLTGTWVNKHNVWGNSILDPNYHYWTIFRFFQEQYPGKKTAIFSTWEDNRTKLLGYDLPETGRMKTTHYFDGLELDTVAYPHDSKSEYIHQIDEAVVNDAVSYIRREAPDLSWVYLQYTDDMGHRFGDSPEQEKAVKIVDDQIGRLVAAMNYRKEKFGEDWIIYVTTDHGRDAQTGRGHGGQTDRERATWIYTNDKDVNNYFHSNQAGIVDIMPAIARNLNIKIPKKQMMEIDGVPITGKISISDPKVTLKDHKLNIDWKVWEDSGNVWIWVSTTNSFLNGGTDYYKLVASEKASNQHAAIDVKNMPSQFYKVVIEGSNNMVNRWVIP